MALLLFGPNRVSAFPAHFGNRCHKTLIVIIMTIIIIINNNNIVNAVRVIRVVSVRHINITLL